jgi:hypothetical protein
VARGGKPHVKMQIANIVNTLKADCPKGSNLSAIFAKTLKTRKGVENKVEKITRIVVSSGKTYDNQAVVIEGRENGTLPSENAGLPWGEWVEFPYHIAHKGSDYVRFYPASGIDFQPKVEYFLDGIQVDKTTIQPLCLASEFQSRKDAPMAMTVKVDNVREIIIKRQE